MARAAASALLLSALGCGESSSPLKSQPDPALSCGEAPTESAEVPYPKALHVVGTHIEDGEGNVVTLRGVNRSGTEYRCIQGFGFFDGPSDEASVQAIASWNVNAVRVPLNEQCWLGVETAPPAFSGCNYKNAIRAYVDLLHKYKLVPILELHWAAPAGVSAVRLQPHANADYSVKFWSDVAATFKHDSGVVFEPYNEPFPGGNNDSDWSWRCWRDGCEEELAIKGDEPYRTFQGAGMQSLVNAIRSAGAENLILLGGVKYSNALTQWLTHKPEDPRENLAAAWHVYNYNSCIDASCWDGAPAEVASQYPLVATEIGEDDCTGDFIDPLMDWLDRHGDGYLAWSWNAFGPCRAKGSMVRGSPYSMIVSYASGTPNAGYAQAFHDHLESLRD